MTHSEAPVAAEFSRTIPLDRIGSAWHSHKLSASPSERAALAERFDLMALNALEAEIRIKRVQGGLYIALEGNFSAAIVQACIVSLQPLPAKLQEKFSMSFGPIGDERRAQRFEIDLDPFLDEPDPIEGNEIDIGEAVVQHLALAIDPYPRAKGVEIPKAYAVSSDDTSEANPFAALKEGKEQE